MISASAGVASIRSIYEFLRCFIVSDSGGEGSELASQQASEPASQRKTKSFRRFSKVKSHDAGEI